MLRQFMPHKNQDGNNSLRHEPSCINPKMGHSFHGRQNRMNALLLFLGSFLIVFALGFQQHNVHYRRYQAAFLNGIFIGIMNLLVLRLGPSASPVEMAGFLTGGPLGSVAAIWLNGKVFAQASEPQGENA